MLRGREGNAEVGTMNDEQGEGEERGMGKERGMRNAEGGT